MQLSSRYQNFILLPSSLSRLFTRKNDSLGYSQVYWSQYFRFDSDIVTEILLYGKENLNKMNNTSIVDPTIKYLIEMKRFDVQRFLCSLDVMALKLILTLNVIFLCFCLLFLGYIYFVFLLYLF